MFRSNFCYYISSSGPGSISGSFKQAVFVSEKALSIGNKNFPKSSSIPENEQKELLHAKSQLESALKTIRAFQVKYPLEQEFLEEFENMKGSSLKGPSSSFSSGYLAGKLESNALDGRVDIPPSDEGGGGKLQENSFLL